MNTLLDNEWLVDLYHETWNDIQAILQEHIPSSLIAFSTVRDAGVYNIAIYVYDNKTISQFSNIILIVPLSLELRPSLPPSVPDGRPEFLMCSYYKTIKELVLTIADLRRNTFLILFSSSVFVL